MRGPESQENQVQSTTQGLIRDSSLPYWTPSTPNYFTFPFKTHEHSYSYDVGSNYIFRVGEVELDIISRQLAGEEEIVQALSSKYTLEEIRSGVERIQKWKALGFLQGMHPVSMLVPADADAVRDTFECSQLTLDLTENCNFRCGYCSLNDETFLGARGYSKRVMSPVVAKRAIDFFRANVRALQEEGSSGKSLGFYGGEPLLAFERVVEVMDYAKKVFGPDFKKLQVTITSNGSLLCQEVIDYLVENAVFLVISLDGYREAHDHYRKTLGGKPTFDTVIAGLERLYAKAPDYYRSHVGINCVIGAHTNLQSLRWAFNYNPLIQKVVSYRIGYISNHLSTFREEADSVDLFARQFDALFRDYLERLIAGSRPSPFEAALFDSIFLKIHRRLLGGDIRRVSLNGSCLPGTRRLFVDINGNLHMCERIARTKPIGNVWDGVDFDRICRFEQEYADQSLAACSKCFAVRLCGLCWTSFVDEKGELNLALKTKYCNARRSQVASGLHWYCEVLEKNPKAFDYLDEYVVR